MTDVDLDHVIWNLELCKCQEDVNFNSTFSKKINFTRGEFPSKYNDIIDAMINCEFKYGLVCFLKVVNSTNKNI